MKWTNYRLIASELHSGIMLVNYLRLCDDGVNILHLLQYWVPNIVEIFAIHSSGKNRFMGFMFLPETAFLKSS